ncbi:XdhC family protein [Christiangramia sp. SM2212]|uniref:XdhC family protein n=1 Tax=Christiangramia sediminicola TaxID=3073267 RepID=A0ABU1EQ46_9FLAO|nr:XdhC family protein [Christiangramia sp. SM2212]MDR5590510.1 XdhC family protein [Christiangramia sp. SM2212]
MRELDAIAANYDKLKSSGTDAVLATVVHVEGSSYRRAGARMLVDEFGNITGAISGGCLEGDALRKALHAMHHKKNKLVTYDTSDEDDAFIGAQLGCNGIIQVLFEFLDYSDSNNPCELLKNVIATDLKQAIVVQFNLDKTKEQAGTKMILDKESKIIGKKAQNELLEVIVNQGKSVLEDNRPHFSEVKLSNKTQHIFIQNYNPPIKLIIVGAGNDAQILATQAELLGWNVIVTDGRPTHANKDRFTSSCQVIVTRPEDTLANIRIDERSCFVLMSHNYNYDLAVLKLLLNENQVPYIGILGPLKKYQRMQDDLKTEEIRLSEDNLKKIHAPVGLEIGAETPAEIGLSILAEIQSVLMNKEARPLKEKNEPIHDKNEFRFKKVIA